jgi:5-methylcytosine-specific restriction endonuclease McrA
LHAKPSTKLDEVSITWETRGPYGQKELNVSQVFVLDTNKQPLYPAHPGQARRLLKAGKAAVYRRYPFTIILKRAVEQSTLPPLRVKIDPGSKVTGIAVVNDSSGAVVWAAELTHRGEQIRRAMEQRRTVRRSRRQRKTRYRQPRWQNRRRRKGTLKGSEVREYVLLKWKQQCAYCGAREVPRQVDHAHPRSRTGSNRVSNLVLACTSCNQRKGNQDLCEFLKDDPARLARILAHLEAPLRDAAAVNTTRWALYERLKAFGLPVECGSGGRTKYNRTTRDLPKTHWLDAASVGASTPERLLIKGVVPLSIRATGHGARQMCRMDRFGFPRTSPKKHKRVKGFQTGDIVRAVVTSGTKQGTHVGKVAVRARGSFNVTTPRGTIAGISHRFCRVVVRSDGYSYEQKKERALPPSA